MKNGDFDRKPTNSVRPYIKCGHLEETAIATEFANGVALEMPLLSFNVRSFRVRPPSRAYATTHFHGPAIGGCRPVLERDVLQDAEAWFVKVVSTLFVHSHCKTTCLHYLRGKLTPFIAFDVVKRFNNPKLGLKFLEFSRLNLNLRHSFWTYNLLLRSLCQLGLHDLAKMVFDYMRNDGHLPDNALLGFLVTSFSRGCKFDTVRKLLTEVQDREVWITSFVYNDLLNLLVKQNRVQEAVCLFKEYLALKSPPDTWTFNILIRGLCRVEEIDEAFELFSTMGSFGCLPDVVTYNTLVNGLCRVNDVDRGHALLKEVQCRNDCSPDVVTYTSVISGFCKSNKMKEASALFEEMIMSGINPNVITFNVLIDGFGKISDMVAAKDMYDKMVSLSCQPDIVTFTSLIDGYCRAGQLNIGLKFWDVMKGRNISPNVYTYAVLINALCKENRLHKARDFLRQLKHSDTIPKPFMYNPVIDGFCKAGNVDEANTIPAEMEEKRCKPDKFTFTILIIGHCMKGRMTEAISIFNKMMSNGCAPDSITISSLVSCLLKAGMPQEASRIVQMVPEDLKLAFCYGKRIPLNVNLEIPLAA
uniref:Pentatricopeptide repeat-containing protein n=1 Tax=Rhizophora mucronata TaxID=61149 RepID=A0A2P2KIG5_RHIMU